MECSGCHGRGAVEMDRGECCVADTDGSVQDLLCYGLCEVEGMELSEDAYREFWELAGGCICWLFCVPVYMGTGGKFWKNRKVRCRDEAEVLELDTE